LIHERTTVQTAKEIDTREGKCTDNYRDSYRRGQVYRQLQRLIQERTRVKTTTEIHTGEDNCTQLQRLIQERIRVQTATEIRRGQLCRKL
jgi:hypothetical protein